MSKKEITIRYILLASAITLIGAGFIFFFLEIAIGFIICISLGFIVGIVASLPYPRKNKNLKDPLK